MFLVGSLHFAFEFVAGVIYGIVIGDKRTSIIDSLGHLLILPNDFVAAD